MVLAPSEKYLNALGTWTPTITVEAIGESWGITPSEVFLRHNGVLHDLNAQLSEGASQRAKIRFLLDTGTGDRRSAAATYMPMYWFHFC